jgi:hypothetical protein
MTEQTITRFNINLEKCRSCFTEIAVTGYRDNNVHRHEVSLKKYVYMTAKFKKRTSRCFFMINGGDATGKS